MKRVAVLDNYDSFTYNLVQQLAGLDCETMVFRNDVVEPEALAAFDALVISPGPGRPECAGICLAAIRRLSGSMPILGVCLGHQALAAAFGGRVVSHTPVHGKTSLVSHRGSDVFRNLPDPLQATRYHSLIVEEASLPVELEPTAWDPDGVIMGLAHRRHPSFGVQFHPESILTPDGSRLLANFLALA
ncbi:MAG: anthranilate synthase component II [Candidatus Dormibacter sp.]|uniref:anthranilate synthase component II n=1 Tax=Candidatus Dormibacter sp. TaxID=2973982 RepID=UPI0026D7F88D